jgi:hypothetical protein
MRESRWKDVDLEKKMHEDAEVLMNEDKKEIIFQGNNSSSLYKKVK